MSSYEAMALFDVSGNQLSGDMPRGGWHNYFCWVQRQQCSLGNKKGVVGPVQPGVGGKGWLKMESFGGIVQR
jgi:hypothetical protein